MIIQHIESKKILKDGDAYPVHSLCNTNGYKCCFFQCQNPTLDMRVDEDSTVMLFHGNVRRYGQGPVKHYNKKHMHKYIRALDIKTRLFRVISKCPTCHVITKTLPLFSTPTVTVLPQCVVLEEAPYRVVVKTVKTKQDALTTEVTACLGKSKHELYYELKDVNKLQMLYLDDVGYTLCKEHKIHINYPIHVFTKSCPDCSAHHGLIIAHDYNSIRKLSRRVLYDVNKNPMVSIVWSIPFDGSNPDPAGNHYHYDCYTRADRSHWFLYSSQEIHPKSKQLIEETILHAPLIILKRHENNLLKDSNRFVIDNLTHELCSYCIELKRQISPCCRMCLRSGVNIMDSGFCNVCDPIFATKNVGNDILLPDIDFPEVSLSRSEISPVCAGMLIQQYMHEGSSSDDVDSFGRCLECCRIDCKQNFFKLPAWSVKETAHKVNLQLSLPLFEASDIIHLCVYCVKKCRCCNNVVHCRDIMSKCHRCRQGRYNKKNFNHESNNTLINQYSTPLHFIS